MRDPSRFPDILSLRRLTRALAMLDVDLASLAEDIAQIGYPEDVSR